MTKPKAAKQQPSTNCNSSTHVSTSVAVDVVDMKGGRRSDEKMERISVKEVGITHKDGDGAVMAGVDECSKDVEADHDGGAVEEEEEDDDGRRPRRRGGLWAASAHIVTAVIGSGVLSLAWSMAKLGWVAGPLTLLLFALITYYTSLLLADCYRVAGRRNYTYMHAVAAFLGRTQTNLCAIVQYTNFIGTAIGYTITASISMVAIVKSNCYHEEGHEALCYTSTNSYILFFGGIQILLSQIPTFSKLWWLSIVAAIMSFSYSSIGVGLEIGKLVISEKGHFHGTLGGLFYSNDGFQIKNIWLIFQALGNIAFAYSYSMILIEIQDTLKPHPPESQIMKRANLLGVSTTTLFYVLCGCIGYAVFGDGAPGNLLTGFGFYEPYWLLNIANACVIIHLIGAYQVFSQPLFAFVEEWMSRLFPKSDLVQKNYIIELPMSKTSFDLNLFRLIWRTAFVIFTTLVSMLLPFFNNILGILGALAFWPLTVCYPVEMHISRCKIPRWSHKWLLLQTLSMFCLVISLAALVGSIQGVIEDLQTYKPFQTQS